MWGRRLVRGVLPQHVYCQCGTVTVGNSMKTGNRQHLSSGNKAAPLKANVPSPRIHTPDSTRRTGRTTYADKWVPPKVLTEKERQLVAARLNRFFKKHAWERGGGGAA
jgi:hypothetical protein